MKLVENTTPDTPTSAMPQTAADTNPQTIAAIDLGSNSFHMVVGISTHGEIRTLDKMGEKVQLAAGLNAQNYLSEEAQEIALDCLRRFAQRIKDLPPESVQVVGTNALRVAKNARAFIRRAEEVIGHPVEVIAGREEARLIYLGVAHTLADDAGNRLVMDIGGGSTEFIIGERFETKELESLHMGCVSFRERFFKDGTITKRSLDQAITEASRELISIRKRYQEHGWASAVGSSGSIKAVYIVAQHLGLAENGITQEVMDKIISKIVELGHVNALAELGIKKDRLSIFPAGLAILYAAFKVLNIKNMHFADGALREGLLYDLAGRIQHEDVRERTISALQMRYHIDTTQGQSVEKTAMELFAQVAKKWQLEGEQNEDLLRWAARLHEIGLAISHTQFHKHGAYMIRYADLAGFTQQTQYALAALIRGHRRKLVDEIFTEFEDDERITLLRLCILLRLSVLLNRSRAGDTPPELCMGAFKHKLTLSCAEDWLVDHPLTQADLSSESDYLAKIGYKFQLV